MALVERSSYYETTFPDATNHAREEITRLAVAMNPTREYLRSVVEGVPLLKRHLEALRATSTSWLAQGEPWAYLALAPEDRDPFPYEEVSHLTSLRGLQTLVDGGRLEPLLLLENSILGTPQKITHRGYGAEMLFRLLHKVAPHAIWGSPVALWGYPQGSMDIDFIDSQFAFGSVPSPDRVMKRFLGICQTYVRECRLGMLPHLPPNEEVRVFNARVLVLLQSVVGATGNWWGEIASACSQNPFFLDNRGTHALLQDEHHESIEYLARLWRAFFESSSYTDLTIDEQFPAEDYVPVILAIDRKSQAQRFGDVVPVVISPRPPEGIIPMFPIERGDVTRIIVPPKYLNDEVKGRIGHIVGSCERFSWSLFLNDTYWAEATARKKSTCVYRADEAAIDEVMTALERRWEDQGDTCLDPYGDMPKLPTLEQYQAMTFDAWWPCIKNGNVIPVFGHNLMGETRGGIDEWRPPFFGGFFGDDFVQNMLGSTTELLEPKERAHLLVAAAEKLPRIEGVILK